MERIFRMFAFVTVVAVAILAALTGSGHAAGAENQDDVTRGVAEAEYRAGENEAPSEAKEEAKKLALRKFVEKTIGMWLNYSAEAKDTRLVSSLIDVWASGYVKIDSVHTDEYFDYVARYRATVSTTHAAVQEFQKDVEQIKAAALEQQRRVLIERTKRRYAVTASVPDMVLVPAEKGEPPLRIDRHPVSVLEYQRFDASYYSGRHYLDSATGIEWRGAVGYCKSRGLRLPTDIEWERARTHAGSLGIIFPPPPARITWGGQRGFPREYRCEWLAGPVKSREVWGHTPKGKDAWIDAEQYPMKDLLDPWKLLWFDRHSSHIDGPALDNIGFRCVYNEAEPHVEVVSVPVSTDDELVIWRSSTDYSLLAVGTTTPSGSVASGLFAVSVPVSGGGMTYSDFGFGMSYTQLGQPTGKVRYIEIPFFMRVALGITERVHFVVTPSAGLLVILRPERSVGASYSVFADVRLGARGGPFLGIGYQRQVGGGEYDTVPTVVVRGGIEFPSIWWWF